MTFSSEEKETESNIPSGQYEAKREKDLREEKHSETTDESAKRKTEGRKVEIDTTSSPNSIRVNVDVEAEKRKAEIAKLNERLRRLRSQS